MISILLTDGYKFSMAEAGWPLRNETFYYNHRFGGAMVVPLDIEGFIRRNVPTIYVGEADYLKGHSYELGAAFRTAIALGEKLKITALPKFSIFKPREPVVSITGPSALVSWFEPLLLQLHFRFQITRLAMLHPAKAVKDELGVASCQSEKEIILETLDAVKVEAPRIEVDEDGYFKGVLARVKALSDLLKTPGRIFEVGLRSATCLEQHVIALRACKEAGITLTSNVLGAERLGMTPVGTMGHEHVQRYGNDEDAFRAMRDRRPGRSSYLLDTFDTFLSGIPAAFKIIEENPDHQDSIRYDSGDKKSQYLFAVATARERGLEPVHIFEDAFDLEKTKDFEELRSFTKVPSSFQHYGYGGFIVSPTGSRSLTRDKVAANFKLSQTGPRATMKFSNDAAKESIPGRPVVFRRMGAPDGEPVSIIGQEGEAPPKGYFRRDDLAYSEYRHSPGADDILALDHASGPVLSPETKNLRDQLLAKKRSMF